MHPPASSQARFQDDLIEDYLRTYTTHAPEFLQAYMKDHHRRFVETLNAIPRPRGPGETAIEIGTYGLFPVAMRAFHGYARVDGSVYEQKTLNALQDHRSYPHDPTGERFRIFDLNVERVSFPLANGTYDFILAAEVLEHFATDPSFFMAEANRLLKPGGRLLVTTPNVCSEENVFRILQHEVPNPFHYYRIDGSNDRHNLEYSPRLLRRLAENAGFTVTRLWTEEFWSCGRPEIRQLLERNGYSTDLRGDDLFLLCEKTGPVGERFPSFLYF